jgi:uncharacterized protein
MLLDNILTTFVKYPQAGLVKTRLAKKIGDKNAALLYRLFTEAILARTKDNAFRRYIFYTPTKKKNQIKNWLGSGFGIFPQKGRGLGERLSYAFEFFFRRGAKRVIVIGTDNPLLDKNIILKSFEKLKSSQCVIGPSQDGGYYLLGLSCFYKEIFQGIDWSTDKVLRQTLRLLKKLKIKFSLLDESFDVDNMDDLINLKERLPEAIRTNSAGLIPISKQWKRLQAF